MTEGLSWLIVSSEADVFAARQRARAAATLLGMDVNDQVRVATAVSEIGRLIVTARRSARVNIGMSFANLAELSVEVTVDGDLAVDPIPSISETLDGGRRLMDSLEVTGERPFTILMSKALPEGSWPSEQQISILRGRLDETVVSSPLEELRSQNLDLLVTSEALRTKQDELVRVNDELEETNRGVMAMYSQLSEELEETNRGVVALYAELDERRLQLHHASESKSRFLASVSHELRSPLNSIRGLARLLQEPDSEPMTVSQAHQIRLIDASASELLGLVNDLLDLAKAESGRLDPRPQTVDLSAVMADLRATLRPLCNEGVEIIVDIGQVDSCLETDLALFTQLLRNLLINALKFTEKGWVRVGVDSDASANQLTITVEDTGIGIAADHHELVFEEFFQVAGSLQSRSKNSGLGLPYARRVAHALGGSVALDSELGLGSTFTVRLPIRWITSPRTSAPTKTSEPAPLLDIVLVVDDERSFRELLRQMMQGMVGRVVEAEDAPSAIQALSRVKPDLVVLDLRMPGGGGEEVLSYVSGHDSLHDTPVVVMTSALIGDELRRRLASAVAFVDKSDLTKERLRDVIDCVSARR